MQETGPSLVADNTEFTREGPASENHDIDHNPMGIYWNIKKDQLAGVAPPSRPPPARWSRFPTQVFHHGAASTGFIEGPHRT